MLAVVVILSALSLLLILYLIFMRLQLRGINAQLSKRLLEGTRQPVSLGLLDRGMNRLAVNINKSLKAEENLRLNILREEKQFKEMIANISHDLRTPLTAIRGYQQLMAAGELTEEQRNRLAVAQKHAGQLGGLIDHFFEYAYLLNTEVKPALERVNLTNLTSECLAASVVALEQSGLEVRFDGGKPVYALADREMTTRILNNLIRNCTQHAHGFIEVSIRGSGKAEITFTNPVDDPAKIDCAQLFDRFYTSDQARGGGTGLGLSIVKILAERMGGGTAASLEGDRLTVKVVLPLYGIEDSTKTAARAEKNHAV